jgi:hypothetical protein
VRNKPDLISDLILLGHDGHGTLLIDIRIGDSHDELERMLAVLRFSFSKELKFVRARLGKPYNSALGESLNISFESAN